MDRKKIILPRLSPEQFDRSRPAEFSRCFDSLGRPLSVDCRPWEAYPDKPEVRVRAALCGEFLIVKFTVREKEVLGRYREDNAPVYQDSCVELFLSPEGEEVYYNFEFNCLGSCLAQVGPKREERTFLDPALLQGIFRVPSLGREPCHHFSEGPLEEAEPWSLLVAVPGACFVENPLSSLENLRFRGNFYKCGDSLRRPHYLSWSPIGTEQPDFHRPEFFGEIWPG